MTLSIHILSWILIFILFTLVLLLHTTNKGKLKKILEMILRVMYLVTMATGVILVFEMFETNPLQYILKIASGIAVIALLEILLGRINKGKLTTVYWVLLVFALIAVFYLGYSLPLSLDH